MLFAAAYAPPFRASIVLPVLKRRMTAMSVYAAAGPDDRPVAASSPAPLGVASNVAVIVADPGATPVTLPFTSATATDVLLLDHVTVRPDSGLPLASCGVAVSCADCPAEIVADAGVTLTDATGTVQPVTVTLALSDRLPGLLEATTWNEPQLALW